MLRVLLVCAILGSSYAQEDCQIDLAFAVDGSGSIAVDSGRPENWDSVVGFLRDVINGLSVGTDATRVAMVKFDERATEHFRLNTYATKQETIDAALALDYNRAGGRTNTDGALTLIRDVIFQEENGDRPDVRNVLILLTDGKPTDDLNRNLNETLRLLNEDNVRLIGVGVTDEVDEDFMRSIVSDPETDYFSVTDFINLAQILEDIIEQSCRIVTDCNNNADLYLVMDGSGSIDEQNFGLMKEFAVTLVESMNINSGGSRVGFVLFSDNAEILFDLDQFNDVELMAAFIRGIAYPRGATNTERAFNMVRTQGFTSGRGDRDNIPNAMVLLTDGNSNTPENTFDEAYTAKAENIHIITVGIGNWINGMELTLLASYPYDLNYIHVPNFQGLNDELRKTLTDLICNNINDCRNDPCINNGVCQDMIGMYVCECPSGFGGARCQNQCRVASDVTFALDSSGSVGRDNFLLEIDFVREIVMGLNINEDTRVAALQYANNAQLQFDLNDFTTKVGILNGLAMLYLAGTTNTAAAIQMMRNRVFTTANGDRSNVQNIGVVITDGRSNDFDATWSEARQARSNGIEMVAVGVGTNLRHIELEAIASYPVDQNVLTASGFETISSVTSDALNAICNNEDACGPPNPCENEGVCVDLLNGYRCQCQDGWSGNNCERNCNKRYDIILAIDKSGSIRNERMPQVLDFVVDLVAEFEVSDQAARFGAITFSDTEQVEFQLNTYSTKQDVMTAIKTIRYSGGRTNIASVLEEIKDNMFTAGNGDRDGVLNYIVLFTDGASNIREDETMQMAIDARVAGIKILSVAIGSDVNMLEMRGITSQPTSNMMMMAESFTDMTNNEQMRTQIINNVIAASCNDNDECSPDPCQNGVCIDDLHAYYCECDNDFSGQNCDRTCTNQMDVVLVLDFSGSLDQVSDVVIALAREIVQGLPFTLGRARVAVVSYSDDAVLSFDLDAYLSKREVLNALSFSRYGGRTQTQAALQMTYDSVFTVGGGDRPGAPNKAIVVTDGGSNIQRDQTINRANEMRNRGIEVFVAAVYNAPDMGEVNGIASDSDSQHVVLVPDANAVASAADQLLDWLCD